MCRTDWSAEQDSHQHHRALCLFRLDGSPALRAVAAPALRREHLQGTTTLLLLLLLLLLPPLRLLLLLLLLGLLLLLVVLALFVENIYKVF